MAAITLVAIGGMLAMAINVGHMLSVRTELSAAYDATALAAVRQLNGTATAFNTVGGTARDYGTAHRIHQGTPVSLNWSIWGRDIDIGVWHGERAACRTQPTPDDCFETWPDVDIVDQPYRANAVRVRGGADGDPLHNESLSAIMGAFLGFTDRLRVRSQAIAVGGGPCDEACPMPLAIPRCAILDGHHEPICDQPLAQRTIYGRFGSTPSNNMAFTVMTDQVNAHDIRDVARDAAGACAGPRVQVRSEVAINNGVPMGSFLEYFQNLPTDNPPGMRCADPSAPNTPDCPTFSAPVVDVGNCATPLNGTRDVIGFVKVTVICVQSPGSGGRQDPAARCNTSNEDMIGLVIQCGGETASSGCANFGWGSPTYRLVR